MIGYLNRLKRRMVRRGFPPDDRLLSAARAAEEARHALHVEVHYIAVGDVTGRLAGQRNDKAESDGNYRHSD